MRNKYIFGLFILVIVACMLIKINDFHLQPTPNSNLPLIAIANYGPHDSLNDSITGLKEELVRQGYIEHQNIEYLVVDVGFDTALIPQMIANIQNKHPQVIVVQATPVAQYAKHTVKNIPLIFTAITDPIAAGLQDIGGSSDRQDLRALLQFSKQIMPKAKRVGILYSTSEANDLALIAMMQEAATAEQMQLLCIPIEHSRDIPLRMQVFKDKVDIIYVGVSGVVQPSLPAIAAIANKMGIAVFNADHAAVEQGLAVASFGVNYKAVGANAGKIVVQALRCNDVTLIKPIYPALSDHQGYVNRSKAKELDLEIPAYLSNVIIVD